MRRTLDLRTRAAVRAAATAGIYRFDDRGGWRPEGGGVCVRLAGRPFVVSAGRVLAPAREPLWLGGRRAIVPLVGAAVLADGPDAPPEIATLDAAFGLIAQQDAEALAGDREFLGFADIDVADTAGDDVYYAVAAPPLDDEAPTAVPAPVEHVRLRQASSTEYRRQGVTADTHLVLRPDDAGTVLPAHLRGCGIWRVVGAASRDPLAGIVLRADATPRPCVVAMRPCYTVLGIVGCLSAGMPAVSSVRRPN